MNDISLFAAIVGMRGFWFYCQWETLIEKTIKEVPLIKMYRYGLSQKVEIYDSITECFVEIFKLCRVAFCVKVSEKTYWLH